MKMKKLKIKKDNQKIIIYYNSQNKVIGVKIKYGKDKS